MTYYNIQGSMISINCHGLCRSNSDLPLTPLSKQHVNEVNDKLGYNGKTSRSEWSQVSSAPEVSLLSSDSDNEQGQSCHSNLKRLKNYHEDLEFNQNETWEHTPRQNENVFMEFFRKPCSVGNEDMDFVDLTQQLDSLSIQQMIADVHRL